MAVLPWSLIWNGVTKEAYCEVSVRETIRAMADLAKMDSHVLDGNIYRRGLSVRGR